MLGLTHHLIPVPVRVLFYRPGVPFYTSKQGAWGGISAACPSVAPDVNNCSGALFVGKSMCAKIGEHIQRVGYGGVFPWCDCDRLAKGQGPG